MSLTSSTALHDTGDNPNTGKVSHATGKSIGPQTLQEGLPEKVEKVVPNSLVSPAS